MSVIDPDNDTGTDYLSLSAFVTGEAGDQGAAAVLAEFRSSSGSADTTNAAVNGFSNYSSFDIKPHTDNVDPGGVYSASSYRIEGTTVGAGSSVLAILDPDIIIDTLQVQATNSGGYSGTRAIHVNIAGTTRILNSIIKGVISGAGSHTRGIELRAATTDAWIENTLIYDFVNSAESCFGILSISSTNPGVNVYNSTIINCRTGLEVGNPDSILVVNTITQNCNNGFNGTFDSNSDYNLSDLASDAPGSNSVNSSTLTFVGGDDYHLVSGDAIGAGVGRGTDSNVPQYDVDGDERPLISTTDIGFDLFVAVGGLSIPVAMNHYRNQGIA